MVAPTKAAISQVVNVKTDCSVKDWRCGWPHMLRRHVGSCRCHSVRISTGWLPHLPWEMGDIMLPWGKNLVFICWKYYSPCFVATVLSTFVVTKLCFFFLALASHFFISSATYFIGSKDKNWVSCIQNKKRLWLSFYPSSKSRAFCKWAWYIHCLVPQYQRILLWTVHY